MQMKRDDPVQAVPVRIAVIFDLYVDRGTQSYLGRLHNSFVHGRVCVDCVCDLLYRRSQRFGERRLGQHFGYVRSHQMCSQQLVVLVEDQFYEAVAVACGGRFARSGEGEASHFVVDTHLLDLSFVIPTEATSGEVNTHEGIVV